MDKKHGLFILLIVLGILTFFLLRTYWSYLAFAMIFAILCKKPYDYLRARMHPNLAAMSVVLGILLLLVIPTIYIMLAAIEQVPVAYTNVVAAFDKESVRSIFGVGGDEIRAFAIETGGKLRTNIVNNSASYLNQASYIFVGLFIMFTTIFFLLRDGKKMYEKVYSVVPMRRTDTLAFFAKMRTIVNAVLLGQLVTAVIQGALAGALFWALGVQNALLLGIVTIVLSVIPVLGPFLVYLPVSGYLFLQERYVACVLLLVFGTLILSQIDNVIRPYIANRTASVHPLTTIVGVIAGLKLWGLVGFILGPLVLAAFLAMIEFVLAEDEHAFKTVRR